MLPNEISNIICSYIESPTNKIIKDLYFNPIVALKLNRQYNFIHLNINRLLHAVHTRCPHCLNTLTPNEYLHSLNTKLCFECLHTEQTRIVFELSEIFIIILIFFYIIYELQKIK